MNKNYLILAAAAAMLASCAETEKLNNELRDNQEPTAIAFNTISEKATRSTTENLETYHGTFAVYATKKSNNDANAAHEVVFCGEAVGNTPADIITYDATQMAPNNWTYSPYRYWDKQATYNFVAVAPNASIIKYNMPENVADNAGEYITATAAGYTLIGQNLQSSTAPAEAEIKVGFQGGSNQDTDLMTAGKETKNGAVSSEVNLLFKHILAKLNISIAKDPTLDNTSVLIRKVEITGLDDKGTYIGTSSTTTSGWASSASGAAYKLTWANENGVALNNGTGSGNGYQAGKPLYFIESLIMPQAIETNVEKLTIDYTIVSSGNPQNYNYVLKFDDGTNKIFDSFMDGNNYTIILTVKPNVITFDASTVVWADQNATADIQNN